MSPEALKELIERSLDADKALDIQTVTLKDLSSIADYMIFASGASSRQVVATAEKLRDRLAASGVSDVRIEGREGGNWIVLDAGDVVVHLFRPEVRAFYNLEKMWALPHAFHPVGPQSGATAI